MTPSTPAPAAPLDLVIFGGAGDLALRKLLPALYMAHLHHNLPEGTRIVALGRQAWDRAAFIGFIAAAYSTVPTSRTRLNFRRPKRQQRCRSSCGR